MSLAYIDQKPGISISRNISERAVRSEPVRPRRISQRTIMEAGRIPYGISSGFLYAGEQSL